MAEKNDPMSFEEWLEKESQAMNELYNGMEPIPAAPAPAGEEKKPEPASDGAGQGESAAASDGAGAEKAPAQPAGEEAFGLEAAFRPEEPEQQPGDMDFEKEPAPEREPVRMRSGVPPQSQGEGQARPQSRPREPLPPQAPARRPVRYSNEELPPQRPRQDPYARQDQPRRRPPTQMVQPDRARRGGSDRPPSGWDGDGGRHGNRWLNWLIPLAAVLMVLVIVLAVGFAQARKVAALDTIYPNISVNGVDVGGMTVEQAAAQLGDGADRYENAAVTVNFPTGDSVTVKAEDIGLKPADGAAAAQAAYDYGRDGSLLANWKTYRACKSEPVELTVELARSEPDEGALLGVIVPAVRQVNEKLGVTKADVGEDEITLVKGMGPARVDENEVCRLVKEAFAQERYDPIDCQLTETDQEQDDGSALLQELYDQVFREPVSAEYDKTTGSATESVQGVRFDMEEAKRLWQQAKPGETVVIPLIREDPEVTEEELEKGLFADVLAEKSTTLAGSSYARINNITLAAKAMNGVVLQPGEEFGYNACLGERTAAKGYQSAGVYANGQHETAIGGGICQGSSTLYYCAMVANLKITLRYDHYFTVNYLPLGMDATVSWGGPDFKFVNSRAYPIKLEAFVANGYLTVRILGTDEDGSYVQITNDTWQDADFYYAQTYRKVYDKNGNLLSSTKEASSRYHKETAATATPAPTPTASPEPSEPPAQSPPPAESVPPEPTEAPPTPTEAPPEPTEAPPDPTDAPPDPTDAPPENTQEPPPAGE